MLLLTHRVQHLRVAIAVHSEDTGIQASPDSLNIGSSVGSGVAAEEAAVNPQVPNIPGPSGNAPTIIGSLLLGFVTFHRRPFSGPTGAQGS